MIAQIEIASEYLPLETIQTLNELGVAISVYEEKEYSTWNYRDTSVFNSEMSDSEKKLKMYEHACKTNLHRFNRRTSNPIVVELNDFTKKVPNVEFVVKKVFNLNPGSVDNAGHTLINIINKLQEKMQTIDSGMDFFNKKCQVHIGGSHLLLINELILEEDCCTDHLQSLLDEGWRIVSVNHQEARRPDYVLGKYNPAKD